ncbi:4Fe-4S binding protein [Aestuariirhabdus litorea]|uniref:4Fe-4S dicluster domain-containing protein n=1 Tax=Aestuariirhabdus litorea TaxID=2528527 RepID=A0A3P3VMC5_9GAMM|nr:4Fe-4S binding protein [Aestuariirhabdus litorea]RRJ82816.1 4Fe-4S dicluster domain-containing protein [Aestuariirhabdus litorea]RWW92975.1 4Fe-4S dicluster domain-containing protein [Endozoicomonadaceae bacterium GTF-13]
MNAKSGFDQARMTLDGNSLQVDVEFCINLRSRFELCSRCVDVCPSDAIQVSIDAVEVDRESCQNCGACNALCPTAALTLSGFDPQRFAESVSGLEEVHLHCRESRDGGGGVIIPCHHLLDAELIVGAGAERVKSWALHGLDQCERCLRGDAREHCAALGEQLQNWLGPAMASRWQLQPQEKADGERLREDQQRLSRRGFLGFASARGIEEAIRWVVPESSTPASLDTLPFYQQNTHPQAPRPYRELLNRERGHLSWKEGAETPWRQRHISESCTLCGSCGSRCPTGALLHLERNGMVALGYQSDLCTDCGLCEQVCPVDAIRVSEKNTPAAVVSDQRQLLIRRKQTTCSNCGHPYLPALDRAVSETELCPSCANEKALDDDWMAMLGE